ncbi:oxidoreductase [Necropsobacter rosorum]|uniref:oxidoreductase n=2 Tax=Pasteurellaceae TaxID=712 RepID=UPI003562F3CA
MGEQMLNIAIAAEFELSEKIAQALEQSALAISRLAVIEVYPFSEEQGIRFNNKAVAQIAPQEADWAAFHYVFFAARIEQAAILAEAAQAGCIVIDLLGVCASLPDVPLIVPTLNEAQLVELRQRNIVALPDPQVTQASLALAPLMQTVLLKQVTISSLLPASYRDAETVSKLAGQTAQLLNGIPLDEGQPRLAFDTFPLATADLSAQMQRLFPQADNVIFHSVQVPVFYGIGQYITALSDYEFDRAQYISDWQQAELLQYHPENIVTPVINGEHESGEDNVQLHISAVDQLENGVRFWTVADEQRFNLARMAVKLAEAIYREGY